MKQFNCHHCGFSAEKTTSDYNRAMKSGYSLYCSKRCSGLGRKKHKTVEQKKLEKREYDKAYRAKNKESIKLKKTQLQISRQANRQFLKMVFKHNNNGKIMEK